MMGSGVLNFVQLGISRTASSAFTPEGDFLELPEFDMERLLDRRKMPGDRLIHSAQF